MKKPNVSKIVKSGQKALIKYSPAILTGLGIAGLVTTAVMTGKASVKAVALIEEAKKEANVETLTAVEAVKTTWKCFVPAVVTGATSIACILGANSVNANRNTALATAYKLSETAFSEYRDKVVETIGEKKEEVVRDKVAEERIKRNPVSTKEVIITGKGETLCFDCISGRYFKSDIEKIRKAINELNRDMISEMYMSLNEFYYSIGLPTIKLGDDLGWNVDGGLIDVQFSSQLAEDGTPCLTIDYTVAPRYDYATNM